MTRGTSNNITQNKNVVNIAIDHYRELQRSTNSPVMLEEGQFSAVRLARGKRIDPFATHRAETILPVWKYPSAGFALCVFTARKSATRAFAPAYPEELPRPPPLTPGIRLGGQCRKKENRREVLSNNSPRALTGPSSPNELSTLLPPWKLFAANVKISFGAFLFARGDVEMIPVLKARINRIFISVISRNESTK